MREKEPKPLPRLTTAALSRQRVICCRYEANVLQEADNRIKNAVILWCRCNLDDDAEPADNKSQTSAEILPVILQISLRFACCVWVVG